MKIAETNKGNLIDLIVACFLYLFISGIAYGIFNPQNIQNSSGVPAQLTTSIIYVCCLFIVVKYLLNKHSIDFSRIVFARSNLFRAIWLGIIFGIIAGIIQFPVGVVSEITKAPKIFFIQPEQGLIYILIFVFLASLVGPILEEIFFRGLFYPILKSKYNIGLAVMLTTIVWSFSHTPNTLGLVYRYILISLLLIYVYENYNIVSAIVAHCTGNLIWYGAIYIKAFNLI